MKKLFLIIPTVILIAACSKSPIGPAVSSFALSSSTTCPTGTTGTTTCASTSNGGATSVSTAQTGVVSTRAGDTGVTSVNVSTGVNSSVSGASNSASASTGGSSSGSTSSLPTVRLSNHYTSSEGATAASGYFDFSAGVEVIFTNIASGDFGFRGASKTNIMFGSGVDFTGLGCLKLLTATSIDSVTSVSKDGFVTGLGTGSNTETDFVNKCIAVQSIEGKYYVLQIIRFDTAAVPTWIEFKWKAL